MELQKFTDYTLDVQRCQSCLELGANFQGGSELPGAQRSELRSMRSLGDCSYAQGRKMNTMKSLWLKGV